ncbi:hypothetical protein ZWY2020_043086 [Hordeum vulgare]|nr:hypothetical protein ZWY2020_043086 [Hordeum vulgare]
MGARGSKSGFIRLAWVGREMRRRCTSHRRLCAKQHMLGKETLELFDHREFDRWVETGEASAIPSSLRQYREVRDLGFNTFLLIGRRVVCSFLIECPVQIIARYAANKSMDGCAFCNADGDFLIMPQQWRLKGNTRSPLELLGGQTCTTSNNSSKEG